MSGPVRELDRLLAHEIARRLPALSSAADSRELWAALHSLKGSVAMAGYAELALVLGQARFRSSVEPDARSELRALLEQAHARLLNGLPPLASEWPEPPAGLASTAIEPQYRAEYHAAFRDRLGQLDAVLASHESALEGLERAQRSIHALKGAAGAVGDDLTAWYCHGLEARLRAAIRTEPNARDVLVDLGRHRALLALLVESPTRGLHTLQALGRAERLQKRQPSEPPEQPRKSGDSGQLPAIVASATPSEPPREAALHVSSEAIARLRERLERVELVRDDLGRANGAARRFSARVREVRTSLVEALRLLGPARPGGPPLGAVERLESATSALRSVLASADRGAQSFRQSADFLRARTDEMRSDLAGLQRTSMGALFERVASAGTRLAAAEGKLVRIEIAGSELQIDRALGNRLYDALVQLVRNAIAHGIQSPAARLQQGRAAEGTLWLHAERHAEALRVSVEDDGRGADSERIRMLAVAQGALSPESARGASERQLLSLLFLPGLTTHPDPSLLAGRGLGLDLVQETARGLGGSVRLEQRAERGLRAVFELPFDQALTEVLWVEEGGHEFAVPVTFVSAVRLRDGRQPARRLASCVHRAGAVADERPAELELVLELFGVEPARVGIDRAGAIEEVTLRALPPAIARSGPYAGAILRSDGSLRLSLDVPLLAAQVFAA